MKHHRHPAHDHTLTQSKNHFPLFQFGKYHSRAVHYDRTYSGNDSSCPSGTFTIRPHIKANSGACHQKNNPNKAADSRYLHRGEFNWSLAPNRNIADTVQGKLFHALDHLEHIRSAHSVFSTTASLRTIDTWDSSILAIVRENDEEKFIGIYNFGDQDKVAWINEDDGIYTDLITEHQMEAKGVMIPAFGCFWLCRKK